MRIAIAGLLAALIVVPVALAQSSDFPGASDMRSVSRPANSFLIGAMHIDDDEYQVPTGPVERGASALGKSVTARGPIDVLAYAGPTTASTLTTYSRMAVQLTGEGYSEVWSCLRKTCGDSYTLAGLLAQPLVNAMHTGSWGGKIIDSLYTSNDDVRFGTFKKGAEYILVMGVLSPGHPSGALIVRVNGPATEPVLTASTANDPEPPAAPPAPAAAGRSATKDAAKSIWSKIPH